MSNLRQSAGQFVEARKLLSDGTRGLIDALKNTNIPLEERWDAYVMLVEGDVLTKVESYGDGFIDTLNSNMTLYDDFHTERHETKLYPDMYDHIMEADGDYQKRLVEARENGNVDKWREEVLASGTAGFEYDW